MPYKGVDEDQKNLTDFARRPVDDVVVQLRPEPAWSVDDEIVRMLEEMLAAIKSGDLEPSHLIIGWGEVVEVNGRPGVAYDWDAVGLETAEVIGHLHTYATKLAMGEGE